MRAAHHPPWWGLSFEGQPAAGAKKRSHQSKQAGNHLPMADEEKKNPEMHPVKGGGDAYKEDHSPH